MQGIGETHHAQADGIAQVMGRFRNTWRENTLIIITGVIVIGLNMLLLYQMFGEEF